MTARVPTAARSIQRILIVRTDRIGDVILTLPMLATLRKSFPDAYIAMLLRRYTGEIIEGNPNVNDILWYDDGKKLVPFRRMRRLIREKEFDAAIVVYPRLRLSILMFTAGIPIRVGTGYRFYSFLFNKRVYEHRKDARRHELEYNLRLLTEIGCSSSIDVRKTGFFVDVPVGAQSRMEAVLRALGVDPNADIAVIHPGSGGSAREWPVEHFGVLAQKLADERRMQVVVTGTKHEEGKVTSLVHQTGGKAISVAGVFNLKELAALLRSARIFVSNSTGPLHLAVAMKTPVVGLYPQAKAMSVRRWGPYTENKIVFVPDRAEDCNDCAGEGLCQCMASITVEEVFRAVCTLIGAREKLAEREASDVR